VQFPEIMEEAFQFAQDLAVSTTNDKKVHTRHLIGAICLLVPGWGGQIKNHLLQDLHLDIGVLGLDFLRYVLRSYPTDNHRTWRSAFQKVFAFDADLLALKQARLERKR